MTIVDKLTNTFLYPNKYKTDSEAVIIACYFNPQKNPYRLIAFRKFYESIKHLNHRIIECVIGDAKPELEENKSIERLYTKDLLWHKETILNIIVSKLPTKFKYVFWLDTDVIFTNKNWLVEGAKSLREGNNIVQPFEFCVHLEQDEDKPSFDTKSSGELIKLNGTRHPKMWRSFCANHGVGISGDNNYDKHGHVGFAWGARRFVLDTVSLYNRALIGGADHIIAHAAAGQINHSCIIKSFTDDIEAVNDWSRLFYSVVKGKIGYVNGDLYHIWHGDIANRQYLKRIQDFTPTSKTITKKDKNGFYIADNGETEYVKEYFNHREDTKPVKQSITITNDSYKSLQRKKTELRRQYPNSNDSFIDSMAVSYFTDGILDTAIVADLLSSDDNTQTNTEAGFDGGFGNGEFSGGGSGGSWEDNNVSNENFS